MRPRGLRIGGAGASIAILAAIAAALVAAHFIAKARAEGVHDWIHRTHPSCCTGRDCEPVAARRNGAGWIVTWHGHETPYLGEVRQSPAETWACGTPERIRCLFISGGTS